MVIRNLTFPISNPEKSNHWREKSSRLVRSSFCEQKSKQEFYQRLYSCPFNRRECRIGCLLGSTSALKVNVIHQFTNRMLTGLRYVISDAPRQLNYWETIPPGYLKIPDKLKRSFNRTCFPLMMFFPREIVEKFHESRDIIWTGLPVQMRFFLIYCNSRSLVNTPSGPNKWKN